MLPPFENIEGVKEAIAGYAGGKKKNPSYKEVSTGKTGHYESVQVTFEPKKVSYKKLVDIFWRQIDPSDERGQFADKGSQYRTAIFYHDEKQKKIVEASKKELEKSGKFPAIATEIKPFTSFYPAEEYHQDYHKKNPIKYKTYKMLSGREGYLKRVWKDEK